MSIFEQYMNPIWKTLPLETKLVLAESLIRYFINPLAGVGNLRPVHFQQGGIKTESFSVEINGSPFVFIPGQEEVVLGWDGGTNGLDPLDFQNERREMYLAIENCLKYSLQGYSFSSHFLTAAHFDKEDDLAAYVNRATSPLRTVTIPPLLVEMQPQYVGMAYKGDYDIITGSFSGEWDWFYPHKQKIQELVLEETELEEISPSYFLEEGNFFIKQKKDLDSYEIFQPFDTTYQEERRKIEKTGMGLLSADEWEYACGGSTRRLFRWGNQLQRRLFDENEGELYQPNMFGLAISRLGWGPELVENEELVKGGWLDMNHPNILGKLMPYSSYYVNEKDALSGRRDDVLSSGYYTSRKSIRIEF